MRVHVPNQPPNPTRYSQALEQQGRLHEAILAAQAALACNSNDAPAAPSTTTTKGAKGAKGAKGKTKTKTKAKAATGIPRNARRTIEKLLVSLMER